MNPYSDPKYITSGTELKTWLANCKKCSKLTMMGTLLMPIDSLKNITLQRKFLPSNIVLPYIVLQYI